MRTTIKVQPDRLGRSMEDGDLWIETDDKPSQKWSESPWRCCESAQNAHPASAGLRRRPAFAEDLCLIYTGCCPNLSLEDVAVLRGFLGARGHPIFGQVTDMAWQVLQRHHIRHTVQTHLQQASQLVSNVGACLARAVRCHPPLTSSMKIDLTQVGCHLAFR